MLTKGVDKMKFPLKGKYVIMVAPSFVTNFSYPDIIYRLKKLGFDKVVEMTFGAKMVSREYHEKLKESRKMLISTTCPGIVSTIENRYPELKGNLAKIDSPMVAMGKICRKHFPKHKIVFLSPCNFKKIEAEGTKFVDYVIDFDELKGLFDKFKIKKKPFFKKRLIFDKFYNDYTKIYPLGGALAKTAHLRGVIHENEFESLDGVQHVMKFLGKKNEKIKFLDCLFCDGGCIGGPHTRKDLSIKKKTKKIMNYLRKTKRENIPEDRKGLVKKARGISFSN
jgi:iron only hydrogenase large subunit-like protein